MVFFRNYRGNKNGEEEEFREWLPGQPLLAGLPCESERSRVTPGEDDEPTIFWTCSLHDVSDVLIEANERLCTEAFHRIKASSKASGVDLDEELQVVVIRHYNHDAIPVRDPVTFLKTQAMMLGDPRITVYMGKSIDEITIQGHIYVNQEGEMPISIMKAEDRKILLNGGKRVPLEFWHVISSTNGRPRYAVGGRQQDVSQRNRTIMAKTTWR